MTKDIELIFSPVTDPRVEGRCDHLLSDILFIALCTLLSNGEDFEDMVEFGKQRKKWLETVLELPNGIPSHDTFNRVFQIIAPKELSHCLQEDASALLEHMEGKLISFDGKKLRGVSPKSKGNKGLYILSAWVGENRLCIGQKKVKDKSNEITAIPELLDELDVEGSVVSIDAIGCQKDIAKKILDKKANYLLAVKDNQGDLLEEVEESFRCSQASGYSEDWEYDHGRYEERKCSTLDAKEVLSPLMLSAWEGIETVVKVEASRDANSKTSSETRYYISSEKGRKAEYFNHSVRGHWGIENQLHWHLDVTFKEDASRARSGNAPQNLNILRKMALHRLSKRKDRLSLKKRRYRASLNNDYLMKLLID